MVNNLRIFKEMDYQKEKIKTITVLGKVVFATRFLRTQQQQQQIQQMKLQQHNSEGANPPQNQFLTSMTRFSHIPTTSLKQPVVN